MHNKKRNSQSPLDDLVNQLRLTGEIFLVAALRKTLKDDCGLDISALTKPYLGNIGNEPENQFQSLKEQAILSMLKSEELRAANQLKLTEMKVTKEQLKLEQAHKEEQQNFLVQRTETDLHSVTEIVSGTLPVAATSDAFTGSAENEEAVHNLLDSLLNRITLILGRQGSGKTGTGFALGEYFNARHGLPFFIFRAPKEARLLLPDWRKIASRLSDIPNDCFIFIDEFALKFLSLQFNSKDNMDFREQHLTRSAFPVNFTTISLTTPKTSPRKTRQKRTTRYPWCPGKALPAGCSGIKGAESAKSMAFFNGETSQIIRFLINAYD